MLNTAAFEAGCSGLDQRGQVPSMKTGYAEAAMNSRHDDCDDCVDCVVDHGHVAGAGEFPIRHEQQSVEAEAVCEGPKLQVMAPTSYLHEDLPHTSLVRLQVALVECNCVELEHRL